MKIIFPITILVVGFFAGRIYQLKKPETFNAYPSSWSGYYGLKETCTVDHESINDGQFVLADYFQVDDISCRYYGSDEKDGWYSLKTYPGCLRYLPSEGKARYQLEVETIPSLPLSIKSDKKDHIRVRYVDRVEAVYQRCKNS